LHNEGMNCPRCDHRNP